MRCSTLSLLVSCALGLFWTPLVATSQPPGRMLTIGVLAGGRRPSEAKRSQSLFWQRMRELGWVEGQTIAVELRYANGHDERLPALAAELVQRHVDVLIASGTPAVLAAKQATSTIPIVMWSAADPVGLGIIEGLARPSGNITGVSQLGPELASKQLELLREALPGVTRVAVLMSGNPVEVRLLQAMQEVAQLLGLTLQLVEAHSRDDLAIAFATIVQGRAEALYVMANDLNLRYPNRITGFAGKNGLPVISALRSVTVRGGLMSYQHDKSERARSTARLVDKLLKGAKPADLPVEQPTKFELVINLKTAQALGLTLPPTLLFQADEVIR
jgi:ABC-type uncharacterized transport system substrate-binding protein